MESGRYPVGATRKEQPVTGLQRSDGGVDGRGIVGGAVAGSPEIFNVEDGGASVGDVDGYRSSAGGTGGVGGAGGEGVGGVGEEEVSSGKDQLVVPEAGEKAPPSTCTCTELTPRVSEAVPETVMVPETEEPLVGEEMATVGGRATPMAEREREAGELVALLATVILPVTLPAVVGAKDTFRVAD
jgi:hypothetical protein